jgi:DNA-binding SARP family transcriptional activator
MSGAMQLKVLGAIEIVDDGVVQRIPGRQRRAVLAILASRSGQPVSLERISHLLWPEEAPRQHAATVHAHLSHLRRAFRQHASHEVVVTRGPGYALDLDVDQFDVGQFEAMARQGFSDLRGGAVADARLRLAASLDLWNGPAYGELGDEHFLAAEVARLDELRVSTWEHRVEADLRLGRHHELVSELLYLVDEFPLREWLWHQLILASYRSGQQRDALRHYETLRTQLVEELGLDPAPHLRRLQQQVLVQDPDLDLHDPELRHARAAVTA